MTTSFKSIDFPLLKKIKKLPDKCSNCGRNLFQLGDKEPFCQYCTKKEIANKNNRIELKYKQSKNKRLTTDVLENDSIISDKSLKKACFDTFDCSVSKEAKDNFDKAKKIAKDYCSSDRQFNSFLSGSAGRGKSHLALSILKYINSSDDRQISCLFVDFAELIERIKSSFNYKGDSKYSQQRLVDLCSDADYLVIDDLGSEATFKSVDNEATTFVQRVLFQIMQHRQNKSTIVTTNLKQSELRNIYNPKILSRLFRNLDGHVIKFTDETPDSRRRKDLF